VNIKNKNKNIKIFIFANCHGTIYKNALMRADKQKSLDIEHVISYENMENFHNLKDKFSECDILIIQPVQNYPEFKMENLIPLFKKGCQVVRVPFIRFNGYWDKKDKRQLNKFTSAAVQFFPNLESENEVESYLEGQFNDKKDISETFSTGIAELRAIEKQGDVKFTDFILENHQTIPFFRDSYHPTKVIFDYVSYQIVELVKNNIGLLQNTPFVLPLNIEKEYGHFKPIKSSVASVLGLKYGLNTYWKYPREIYLKAVIKYENSKSGKVIKNLDDLTPIIETFQNEHR
jgi:hypothetical protein